MRKPTLNQIERVVMMKEKLAYRKKILANVAFDKDLFIKEFQKAIKELGRDEINELGVWCQNHFDISLFAKYSNIKA